MKLMIQRDALIIVARSGKFRQSGMENSHLTFAVHWTLHCLSILLCLLSFVKGQRLTKYDSDLSLQPRDRKKLSLCKGELRIEMALKSIPFGI